jgi:uncharacterized protein (TIGR03437 family)
MRLAVQAPLLSVAATEINYLVPEEAAPGLALLRHMLPPFEDVTRSLTSTVTIRRTAPALFSSGATGVLISPASPIPQSFALVSCTISLFGGTDCFDVPIQLPQGSLVYLSFYGTGIRGRSSLAAVGARVGGRDVPLLYAGPQEGFPGLDRVDIFLPADLRGSGPVDVAVSVEGEWSNPYRIVIQ